MEKLLGSRGRVGRERMISSFPARGSQLDVNRRHQSTTDVVVGCHSINRGGGQGEGLVRGEGEGKEG